MLALHMCNVASRALVIKNSFTTIIEEEEIMGTTQLRPISTVNTPCCLFGKMSLVVCIMSYWNQTEQLLRLFMEYSCVHQTLLPPMMTCFDRWHMAALHIIWRYQNLALFGNSQKMERPSHVVSARNTGKSTG